MKERPIIFSGPMVRAILNGSKIQTRRIVKPQPNKPVSGAHEVRIPTTTGTRGTGTWAWVLEDDPAGCAGMRCPYGQPGERLWVREAWAYFGGDEYLYQRQRECVWYLANDIGHPIPGGKWRPSIHMPRWASRLTLEVTEIRVERLNEISEEDARAEGVDWETCPTVQTKASFEAQRAARSIGMAAHYVAEIQYRVGFERLWESINGPGSWSANPWVWVVSFRRLP